MVILTARNLEQPRNDAILMLPQTLTSPASDVDDDKANLKLGV